MTQGWGERNDPELIRHGLAKRVVMALQALWAGKITHARYMAKLTFLVQARRIARESSGGCQ